MSQNPNQQHFPLVVGIDIGGTQVRVAVLQGKTLLSRTELLTGEDPLPERLFPRIYTAIGQALAQANVEIGQIVGIGIGCPGPLNGQTGIVFDPPNLPGWQNVPLRDIFAQHYQLPVCVENDANAAALGEYLFGAGRGARNMVYITISTGIGGGVIIDGKILGGVSGTAAELGHITIDRYGERCNCGNIGCLEHIASGTAIARRANEVLLKDPAFLAWRRTHRSHPGDSLEQEVPPITDKETTQSDSVDTRLVAEAAAAGVPLASEIIRDAGEAIGIGLTNFIHIFNPELIILGGGVTQIGPMLLDPAARIVQERAMKVPRDAVRIVQAQLEGDVGLIGAGALIYSSRGEGVQGTGMVLDETLPER